MEDKEYLESKEKEYSKILFTLDVSRRMHENAKREGIEYINMPK